MPKLRRLQTLSAAVRDELKRLGGASRDEQREIARTLGQAAEDAAQARREPRMSLKSVLAVALGIMSAIGGFVDIGDLVFNTQAGATFGFQLLWVVVVGVVGIIVYSEMCGRVSAVSKRPVFDLVRERAGFGAGLATLIASQIVNLMTCAAEVGGVAICFQLLSGLPYRLLIPLAVLVLVRPLWVLPFEWLERVFGYLGLGLLVFAVAGDQAAPRLGRGGARLRARSPRRRQPLGLPLLRGGPARCRHDAVRGLLLLVGRGRGSLGDQGPQAQQRDGDDRLRRSAACSPSR